MSSISRREFLRVSGAAVAGAVLTACAPKAAPTTAPVENQPAEQPTAAEAAKPAEAQHPTTWPIGDVARNRTLIYSWTALPAGNHSVYPSAYNHQTGNAILNEPAAFYAAHSDKTYMWLAESYKYNDDATQCTITFRKGIKWSDGTPFTTKDVKWSMDTLQRVQGLNRQTAYVTEYDKSEVVDDNTLTVYLKQPDFRFFFKSLTFRFDLGDDTAIQPSHIYSQVADEELINQTNFDLEKGWPVSTGPYGVSLSTDQQCYFDLRPTWWAVETGFVAKYPDVWRLQVQLFTTDTLAAQQLINKEIDESLDLRPLVVTSLLAQAGDHVQSWVNKPPYGYTDWWPISVQIDTQNPPYDDKRVRWAVAYALNQQAVVDVGWAGAGQVANSPFPHFKKLDEYMDGIKDLTDKYNVLEQNLDKSAQLMTDAGFTKNADGFWADKDGNVLDANLFAGVPLFGDIAPIIAEQLRSAGFSSEHKSPPDVWTAKTDGRANLFLYGHGGSTIDPYDTFYLYYPEPPAKGTPSGSNITRWQNADFKAIVDEMNKTSMDDPAMKDLFRKGMEIWYEELPDVPMVQWFHRIPVNNSYWKNWPTADNPYMNSALWHLTMLQVVLGLQATGAA